MELFEVITELESNIENIKEEPKEIKEIRKKFEIMDINYFLQFTRKITLYYKQFEKTGMIENEYLMEIASLNFYIEEKKYYMYKEILEKPEQMKSIQEKALAEIEKLESSKKILLNLVSGKQTKVNITAY